jgi:hypothetical protein
MAAWKQTDRWVVLNVGAEDISPGSNSSWPTRHGVGREKEETDVSDDDEDKDGLRLLRKTGGSLRPPLVRRSIPLSMWSNWIADDEALSLLDAPVLPLADGRERV